MLGRHPVYCSVNTNWIGWHSFHPWASTTYKRAAERKKTFKAASSHCSKLHQCDCETRWREWGVSASWGLHWSLKLCAFLKPTAHTVAHAFMRSSPNERRRHTMDLNRCCHRLQKTKCFPFRHQVSANKRKRLYFGKAAATSPQVTQRDFHCSDDMFKDMS